VKFYIDIGKRLTEPRVYQDLPLSVSGKNVLIFDDVADSGGSLVFVKKLLEERDAQKVRTATLFYKPKSVIKPDYFAAQTAAWILFPFERVEMGQLLASKWQEQGIKPMEIKKRVDRLKLITTNKE
jgi:hypoxanthine phosphoribosyltransferase